MATSIYFIFRTAGCFLGAEYVVDACGEAGFLKGESEAFHNDFGSGRVGADINAYVTHNAEEAEQDEGASQQTETLAYARGFVGTLLLDGSGGKQ